MTVNELISSTGLEALALPDGERAIDGAYAGDLLSFVMGRGRQGQCFVTIMSNINAIAVASLLDFSCIVLCEDAAVEQNIVDAAAEKDVNLLRSKLPVYDFCVLLGKLI